MPGATASTSAQNGDSSTTPETAPTSPGGERGPSVHLRPPTPAEMRDADARSVAYRWITPARGIEQWPKYGYPGKLTMVAPGKYERR